MTSLLKDLRSDDDEGSFLECRHGTSEPASTDAYLAQTGSLSLTGSRSWTQMQSTCVPPNS